MNLKKTFNEKQTQDIAEELNFLKLLYYSTPNIIITPTLVGLNILFFMAMVLSGVSLFEPTGEQLIAWGANFAPYTVNQEWWRLFSSTFLHIGLIHLLFNMWCLWTLGNLAERMFGNWTFLGIYVFCGIGGSLNSMWWHPGVVSAGASGAVFGIVGGIIMFLYVRKLPIPKQVIKRNLKSLLTFVCFNFVFGLVVTGVDNAAHLGGFVIGMVMGTFLNRPLPPPKKAPYYRYFSVFSMTALLLFLFALSSKNQIINEPQVKYRFALRLHEKGDYDQAIKEYKKILAVKSDFVEVHHDLGIAYLNQALYDEAIREFRETIQLNPDSNLRSIAHCNIALAYMLKKEFRKSMSSYKKAIELNPDNFKIYYFRGITHFEIGKYDLAIADFNKALEIAPNFVDAYNFRGQVYEMRKQYNKAVTNFAEAIKINPSYDIAYNSLAWLLATCPDEKYRNGIEAVKFAQKSVTMNKNAAFLDTLAAAYAEAGNFKDAIRTQEKAITLLNQKESKKELAEYREHLRSYQVHRPWREW